jgi:hypothetical protein
VVGSEFNASDVGVGFSLTSMGGRLAWAKIELNVAEVFTEMAILRASERLENG